jgi:hypothetical protein
MKSRVLAIAINLIGLAAAVAVAVAAGMYFEARPSQVPNPDAHAELPLLADLGAYEPTSPALYSGVHDSPSSSGTARRSPCTTAAGGSRSRPRSPRPHTGTWRPQWSRSSPAASAWRRLPPARIRGPAGGPVQCSLAAQDFYSPKNAPTLDSEDLDLGSGSPVGLPFGTNVYPDLLVQGTKDGRIYVLNRNSLGGREQGPGGTDATVRTVCCFAGLWGHPGGVRRHHDADREQLAGLP